MANLEVKPTVLYVHSMSFFEDSANYILQPQVRNPILLQLLVKETIMIPFHPPFASIPWNPSGKPFERLLA